MGICICDKIGHELECPAYRPPWIWPGKTPSIDNPIYEPMKETSKTYHEGANDERTAVLARVRRMVKGQPDGVDSVYINGTELIAWLLKRNERYRKNPGGL